MADASSTAERGLIGCAEPPLRQDLSVTLSQCGISVQSTATAVGTLAEIVGTRPDVVVLTQPLGREDALDICRQVRAHPDVQKTPIILVPATPSRDSVMDGLRAGASDLMVKPIAAGTLLRKVSRALDGVGKSLPPLAKLAVEAQIAPVLAEEAEVKVLGRIDIQKLTRKVDKLLALPAVVQRILAISSNDRSCARDLALAVESDPAVTAIVVKRANSAAYGKSQRSFNLQESVVRLGFSLTRSIAVGTGVFRLFPIGRKSVGFDRLEFWRHSLAAAIVARLLAPRAGIASGDNAFMAGLLHDIGKIVLDEYCTDDFEKASLFALKDLIPLRDAERKVFETDHSRVGAAVLHTWKFPEAIVDAVGHHHDIGEARRGVDTETARLGRLIQAANLLAKALGEGHGGDLSLQEMPVEFWGATGLGGGLPTGFARAFDDEVARSREFLGLSPSTPTVVENAKGSAIFLHEGLPPVSVIGLTIERLGWRSVPIAEADQASRFPEGVAQAGVVRASTTERLEAILTSWRRTAALANVPLLGALPQGQRPIAPMEGVTCLVEPYDRSAITRVLP